MKELQIPDSILLKFKRNDDARLLVYGTRIIKKTSGEVPRGTRGMIVGGIYIDEENKRILEADFKKGSPQLDETALYFVLFDGWEKVAAIFASEIKQER